MEVPLSDFWPELLKCARMLHGVFAAFASIMVFAGILSAAHKGAMGDLSQTLRSVLSAGIIAVVIFAFPSWVDDLQLLAHSMVRVLDSDPSQSHERFAILIAGPSEVQGGDVGFWDVLWSDQGGIGKAVLYAIILFVGQIALAIMWLGFVVQQLAIIFAIAASPIFLAALLLGSTRELGVRFLLGVVSISAWPIGWSFADILTSALIGLAAGTGPENAALAVSKGFFLIVVISLWLLASTVAAPYAISKALQSGAQVGTAFLGSFAAGISQGGSYALGAGVTASMNGSSPVLTGTATMAAGVGGLMGGAAGSSGMILPAAIGTMAVMAGNSSPVEDVSREAAEIVNRAKQS